MEKNFGQGARLSVILSSPEYAELTLDELITVVGYMNYEDYTSIKESSTKKKGRVDI